MFYRTSFSLDYYKDTGVVRQLTQIAVFTSNTYEKTCLAVQFTKGYFFSICRQKGCEFNGKIFSAC